MTVRNIDDRVVADFGREWASYARIDPSAEEHLRVFEHYFSIFPFESLPRGAQGFDLGCGSGRWAEIMADRVGTLHCVEPSAEALETAKRRLEKKDNVAFHLAGADDMPLPDDSQDFGYSLGVLHHVPDTARGLADGVRKLRPGAPFLLYLYYRFDNRPIWFAALWRLSDLMRRGLCRLPFRCKRAMTDAIAVIVYLPLARMAKLAERLGLPVSNVPLSAYRDAEFQTMRNDALDRFGTRLEQRFTREEIRAMMLAAGLTDIRFRDGEPFWLAVGVRKSD